MADSYKIGNGFLFMIALCMFLLTTGSPVQNQYLLISEGKQFNPEFDQEDSADNARNVAKRFALRDTNGLFLNHFPVTNSLSTPVVSQHGNHQHHNSILNKSPSTSSAFRQTQRVIESSPPHTEWTDEHYQPPRRRKDDNMSNGLHDTIIPKISEYNDTKVDYDRNTKIQEWKNSSDKLMDSWSYVGIGTTSPANVAYVSRSPDWSSQTTPVLRESMQHGPSIVKTRVPAKKRTMIGYDESTMSQKHFVQLTGGHVTESSVFDTSKQPKTSTYPTEHSEIKTEPIVPVVTPVTMRHADGGYVIAPHMFEESVYHKPSQLHTRTLIPDSWKTIDHGRRNASITVSDRGHPDYLLLSKITEPRGYITETSRSADSYITPESDSYITPESDSYITPESDRQIPTTDTPTSTRPEYMTSQVDQVNPVSIGVKYDTSTVTNSFIDTTSKQEVMTSLMTDLPEQSVSGASSLSTTSVYPFVKNTTSHTRVINSVSSSSESPGKSPGKSPGSSIIQPTSTAEYRFDNNTLNRAMSTRLEDGILEQTEHYNNSTDTTGQDEISQTTPVYIVLNTDALISTITPASNQTHQPIENGSNIVLGTTKAKIQVRKYIAPKRLPAKMKVYDIKEILEGKTENNVTNEKERSRKFRKKIPMKVYDITDPITNNADRTAPLPKLGSINSDTSQGSLSRKHSEIKTMISKLNDKKGYLKEMLTKDDIKLRRVDNAKTLNINIKTALSTRPENTNDKSPVDLLTAKGRPLLTILKNQARPLKTSTNPDKLLTSKQKGRGRNSFGERLSSIEQRAKTDKGGVYKTDMNNVRWLPKQQRRKKGKKYRHDTLGTTEKSSKTQKLTSEGSYHDHNVTIHTGNDTFYITRAIEVIKGLIDKIQAKPIVKAIPRPRRQKYLLIPLGNLTFTEIKKKLLDYQIYMKEFQNDRWSDNSLASEVNTETWRPRILDSRPKQ
ncbi:uncharacterized protein LOC117344285 [Pecten maximus]|uniref:uncharacterized protein LOC117344285 n=1 Tax=Pecten maximus TaxID=6579 RepID=UPI0014584504|nr:uncharacterized protein LOC117344285 [Pecten maximus]